MIKVKEKSQLSIYQLNHFRNFEVFWVDFLRDKHFKLPHFRYFSSPMQKMIQEKNKARIEATINNRKNPVSGKMKKEEK